MLACSLSSFTNKCVSTKVVKIAQIESRAQACLSMTEMQAMTQSVKIAQIESRTQACLSMTEMQAMTQSVKIAQIESRAQACLSMTEMQAMTQSVHNGVIDAFGIRFGASIAIANALHHFEQRLLQKPSTTTAKFTMTMCHRQFVAVSRCSILTPAGLTRGQRCEA